MSAHTYASACIKNGSHLRACAFAPHAKTKKTKTGGGVRVRPCEAGGSIARPDSTAHVCLFGGRPERWHALASCRTPRTFRAAGAGAATDGRGPVSLRTRAGCGECGCGGVDLRVGYPERRRHCEHAPRKPSPAPPRRRPLPHRPHLPPGAFSFSCCWWCFFLFVPAPCFAPFSTHRPPPYDGRVTAARTLGRG